jgi:ABC-type antimicrobial peptide transport system permease subunit
MTWNQEYTQKKQKEMNKAIRTSNKQIKKKFKKQSRSPYTNIYATSTWGAQEKRRKERLFWTIGYIIIGIVVVLGISSIIWVLNW